MDRNETQAALWPDGAIILRTEDGFWDGKGGFVENWTLAARYPPCTGDYEDGIAEVTRETGKDAWAIYLQAETFVALGKSLVPEQRERNRKKLQNR